MHSYQVFECFFFSSQTHLLARIFSPNHLGMMFNRIKNDLDTHIKPKFECSAKLIRYSAFCLQKYETSAFRL